MGAESVAGTPGRRVEGRDGQVGAHDGLDPGVDGRLEREELDLLQALEVGLDRGHERVGIHGRVAVAGEMLGRGDHAVLLDAADEGVGDAADEGRVGADRPGVDDGIVGIDVDVDDRGVGHVDAHGPALEGGDPAHGVGQVLGAGRAERHERREEGRARDPVGRAGLEIGGHEQRDLGQLLEAVGQLGRVVDARRGEEDQAADLGVDDERLELADIGAVGVAELGREAAGDHLADLLFDGHLPQGPGDPAGVRRGEARGRRGSRRRGAAREEERGEKEDTFEEALHSYPSPASCRSPTAAAPGLSNGRGRGRRRPDGPGGSIRRP